MHDVVAQPEKSQEVTANTAALRDEYGSRRGWAIDRAWTIAAKFGALRACSKIDWRRVRQFVFVCRGNICRSPYAARRAKAAGFVATSCGLHIGNNTAVDPMAVAVARRRGLDLANHQPRALARMRPADDDLLIATEPNQLAALRQSAAESAAQVTLLGWWSTPRRLHLTDPYGLSEEYFNRCYMLIDSAIVGMCAAHAEAQRDAHAQQ
ncbi:MAG: hypothetical protein H6817_04330 [Phycisphaerales bacterium]|nr:hypothetical protein [Phycisphaerales bacterium]